MKNKRSSKRRNKGSGVPRSLSAPNQTYRFERSVSALLALNQSFGFNSAGFSSAISFSLGQMKIWINGVAAFSTQVPGYTEFTALFDQYQLRGVEFEIYWAKNSVIDASGSVTIPLLWHALDYDDNATTTIAELCQYPGVMATTLGEDGGKVLRRSFRPIPSYLGDDGSGAHAKFVALNSDQWIDSTYPLVEHKGIKLFLDTYENYGNYSMGNIRIVAKMSYAFRSVR